MAIGVDHGGNAQVLVGVYVANDDAGGGWDAWPWRPLGGTEHVGFPPAVGEMEDAVLVASAAGLTDLLTDGLTLAEELARRWPKSRLPLDWPGQDNWLEGLRAKAADPGAVSATVDHQITQHKLTRVRNSLGVALPQGL